MQNVYVDLLFLINFSMDFLCFFISAKIRCIKLPYVRTLIAASIGGAYSVASLFVARYKLILCVLSLAVMCLLVFYEKSIKPTQFVFSVAIYLVTSTLLGGIMTAIFSFMNEMELTPGAGENELPIWLIAVTLAVSTISTKLSGRYIKGKALSSTAEISIKLNGSELSLNAIFDSGNLLKDSFSGRPIIIVDEKYTSHFFPSIKRLCLDNVEKLPAKERASISIVPCNTVNSESLIVAIRPTRLQIKTARGTVDADALISFGDLSKADGKTGALIPTEFI